MSDPVSTAAAAAAAEPPSGVGEASGQQSVLDLGMAGQGKGFHSQCLGPETSRVVEERRLAASQGAWHEGRT